jgi:hypothetical protein
MIFAGKFGRELVELVRGVAQSAEEDKRALTYLTNDALA